MPSSSKKEPPKTVSARYSDIREKEQKREAPQAGNPQSGNQRAESQRAEIPASASAMPSTQKEEPHRRDTRATLAQAMESYGALIEKDRKKAEHTGEAASPEPAEPLSEAASTYERIETPSEAKPKHRGPHIIRQKTVKYVDLSGHELKTFCLIQTDTGEAHDLKDSSIIGKSETSDIVINNRYVSRRHARITRENGKFYIEDLGSTNKTYINGNKIPVNEKIPIEVGDLITLADTEFLFKAL